MNDLMTNPAFQTYSVCVAVLALKMIGAAVFTGIQRQRSVGYVNPEDARVFGRGADAEPLEKPAVALGLRIQRNDCENIPIFFALGLVYVLSGASATGAAYYCWTYTITRVLHSFAYAFGLQPWRALLFGVGTLSLIGMAVQIIF